MLIKINTDNLFILERLREIDKSYFIVFNTKFNRYEVHSSRQAENTFCVGLPFLTLDERVIDFVQKTRIENIEKLLDEIEKNNKKQTINNQKNILNKLEEKLN